MIVSFWHNFAYQSLYIATFCVGPVRPGSKNLEKKIGNDSMISIVLNILNNF